MVRHVFPSSVVSVFFEFETYTFDEEGQQSAMLVCIGFSGATERPIVVEARTVDGTAMGMSLFKVCNSICK